MIERSAKSARGSTIGGVILLALFGGLTLLYFTDRAGTAPAESHFDEGQQEAGGAIEKSDQPIPLRGVALQLHSAGVSEDYASAIHEIADLGANTILFAVHGYMEHARANAITIDARKTPSPERLAALIDVAHRRELRVMLMPVVLLSHPRGSEWRGAIDPPKWDAWWHEYELFISYYADIAARSNVADFIVGSELVSTEKFTERWQKLIARLRDKLPKTRLGYSANWDHYEPIQFWDRLDFVGMTSYYKLARGDNPSVADIVKRWRPIRKKILKWQRDIGKPLILTEVGWCSQEGAAKAPWNYYQNMKATPAGMEEQRRLYEAFIRVWDNSPGIAGVIWWEWTTKPAGTSDFGYAPKGKPAENVLRQWLSSEGRE